MLTPDVPEQKLPPEGVTATAGNGLTDTVPTAEIALKLDDAQLVVHQ